MGRVVSILIGVALLMYAVRALPDAYNDVRKDVGLKPLSPPDVTLTYSPPLVPVTFYVENGRLRMSYDYEVKGGGATFGVSVSPKPIRTLVVILGKRAREYPVQGRVRIALPNTLSGYSTIEWDNDRAVITVPDPGDLKFPDE